MGQEIIEPPVPAWIGVIGDKIFDSQILYDLISELEKGGLVVAGIYADQAAVAGKLAIRWAQFNRCRYISTLPIDIENMSDLKIIYERNHGIINTTDIMLIFIDKQRSESTDNALRYCTKLKKVMYTCKE